MPIPGSIMNETFLFSLNTVSPLFPSVATLRPLTKTTSTTGQVVRTFADSIDANYQNIPCRRVPLILVRAQEQEKNRPEIQEFNARFQVSLNKFIDIPPETLSQWQVKVDGAIYQIASAEADGNRRMTRLMITDTVAYGG